MLTKRRGTATDRGVHPLKPIMHIAYSPYLDISTKFLNFALFPQKLYTSPYFRKMYVFCLICVFAAPYFDHNVFMHHALHVLAASGHRRNIKNRVFSVR